MFFELKGLTKQFGGLLAVSNFDLYINQKEIVGLIGPNGSGKTTLFNTISGVYTPTKGKVTFDGKDVTGLKPHRIAELGIGRTFQLNPLFNDFTVLQNVTASFQIHPKSSLFDTYFNTPRYRHNEKYILEQSEEILRSVGLYHVKDTLAKNLPHGYQKMLGVARALATKPKLLMLDEPLGGMNPEEIDFTLKEIQKTRENGMTVLIVEHNMQVLSYCDRVYVINFGQKICEGLPKTVRDDPQVCLAYFGRENVA